MYCGQITPSKIDEISPIAIPKQISTISMHTPSLVTIHWYLLKLSSRNENTNVSRADNSVEYWRRLPISNPKPDLHNINVHTKFSENSSYYPEIKILTYRGQITVKNWRNLPNNNLKPDLYIYQSTPQVWRKSIIYSSYRPETKIRTGGRTDGRMYGRWTDGHTDSQRDTTKPRHCRAAGYKKVFPLLPGI